MSEVPKQYVRAAGHMMISHSIRGLLECSTVDAVYVVAEHEWRELIEADVKSAGINAEKIKGYAIPGMNRQTSILNGMQEILGNKNGTVDACAVSDEDTVLIHDAARPFLSEALLDACYAALRGHDGVMPVLPMKDTVYLSDDGKNVSGLLDRKRIYAGQAPELFYFMPYYSANIALMPDRIRMINGATEPAIMAGMDIAMIPGDEDNFKVTTDADMVRFRQIVEEQG